MPPMTTCQDGFLTSPVSESICFGTSVVKEHCVEGAVDLMNC